MDGELFANTAAVENAIVHLYDNLYHEDQPSRRFMGVLLLALLVLTWDLEKDFKED